MATITKQIAESIMAGHYAEERPASIVTYNNMFDGGLSYAVIFAHQNPRMYHDSPACKNVQVIWTNQLGSTL